jgi:hypothetical protein
MPRGACLGVRRPLCLIFNPTPGLWNAQGLFCLDPSLTDLKNRALMHNFVHSWVWKIARTADRATDWVAKLTRIGQYPRHWVHESLTYLNFCPST